MPQSCFLGFFFDCEQVREALKGQTLAGLINNAGVAWPAPLLHQSLTDFKKIVHANLCGTFIVTQVNCPQNSLTSDIEGKA